MQIATVVAADGREAVAENAKANTRLTAIHRRLRTIAKNTKIKAESFNRDTGGGKEDEIIESDSPLGCS